MTQINVGDIVETCSLMPGVVMVVDDGDIEVRHLDNDYSDFSSHSLSHCGIVKLTAKEALYRLVLGKDKLTEIWNEVIDLELKDFGLYYFQRVKEEYEKLITR